MTPCVVDTSPEPSPATAVEVAAAAAAAAAAEVGACYITHFTSVFYMENAKLFHC